VVRSGRIRSKGGAIAAREDRDIGGVGPVAAARDRALHRRTALGHHQRRKPLDLVRVGGRHLQPDLGLVDLRKHRLDHRGRRRRRGQAGDDSIAFAHQISGTGRRAGPARNEAVDAVRIQIADRQVEPVAQRTARQLGADIAEPDKSYMHEVCLSLFRLRQCGAVRGRVKTMALHPEPQDFLKHGHIGGFFRARTRCGRAARIRIGPRRLIAPAVDLPQTKSGSRQMPV